MKRVLSDVDGLCELWKAFSDGNAQGVERKLTVLLSRTISVYDVGRSEKESFYHAFLTGILTVNGSWIKAAHFIWIGGSLNTGQAALPHKNIQLRYGKENS